MENYSGQIHNNQYSLSIRFSSDGFSLSVSDENDNRISTKRIPASLFSLSAKDIRTLLEKQEEIKYVYRSIRLVCEHDYYTLVPQEIFAPAEVADMLYFQKTPDKTEHVLYNNVPSWDAVNIFSVPVELFKALSVAFPETEIEHHVSHLLNKQIKSRGGNSMHIWVRPKTMDTAVIAKGNLLLVNSFGYNTTEDLVYYTLNLFDQLGVDTEDCEVYLYNQAKQPEHVSNLRRYLKHCDSVAI